MNESKRYKPVGRCIYCSRDSTGSALGDDHIIALGLGGTLVLPKSSCRECERATSRVELEVLREALGESRAQLKIASRRHKKRKKGLKDTFLVGITVDGRREYREIHIDSIPTMMAMFAFDPPGILRGIPSNDTNLALRLWIRSIAPNAINRLVALGGSAERVTGVNYSAYCRMLAKIAHSFAVAEKGIESFSPLLCDMIRHEVSMDPVYPYLIGGFGREPVSLSDGKSRHELRLCTVDHGGTEYLCAHIQLFAKLSTPVYQVIVGKLIKGGKRPVLDTARKDNKVSGTNGTA